MKTGNQKRKYAHNRYEDIDKYIWKVFDTFGHDEKIENLVYWTRKLQKERAEFRKKAVKYDKLTETSTLEQVKKEWKELGYEFKNVGEYIIITRNFGKFSTDIYINYLTKTYSMFKNLTFQEHQLLTKTFKALGWYDE